MNLLSAFWAWLTRAISFALGVFIVVYTVLGRHREDIWLLLTAWFLIGGPMIGIAEAFLKGRFRIMVEPTTKDTPGLGSTPPDPVVDKEE